MSPVRKRVGVALIPGIALVLAALAGVSLAATGSIQFVKEYVQGQNGIDGLTNNDDVTVSPDGENVYSMSGDDGLATFDRNKNTGKLSFVNVTSDGGENVAVSPDGRSVYATHGGSVLSVLKRNLNSGKLSPVQEINDGQNGVTGIDDTWDVVVSPDGRNVYVTDDSTAPGGVATFKRNKQTGKLTFLNDRPDGGSGGNHLASADGVAISPKGNTVYVTSQSENAITTFKRKATSGSLKLVNSKVDGAGGVTDLQGAYQPVVSGDGKRVYVTAYLSNAIVTFRRDKQTGKLKFVDSIASTPTDPIPEPFDVVVSADGKSVYVACYDHASMNTNHSGLVFFKRNPRSGKLTYKKILRDGSGGVTARGLWRVAISPDDRSLYTADYDGNSVALFKRSK
jgi:DNA-binding beta-propeller fold protein YncE